MGPVLPLGNGFCPAGSEALVFILLFVWTIVVRLIASSCSPHHTSLLPEMVREVTGTWDRSLANYKAHQHKLSSFWVLAHRLSSKIALARLSDEMIICDALFASNFLFPRLFFRTRYLGEIPLYWHGGRCSYKARGMVVGCISLIRSQNVEEKLF